MVNAVVLAGGKQRIGHYKSKADIEFNGRRCIDYVVDALHGARNINKVLIVGDIDTFGYDINDYPVTPDRGTFTQNAATGYEYFRMMLKDGEPLFYIFSDIPFVSAESIDDFIGKCDFNADINIGLANIERIRERFSGYKKNYPSQNFDGYGFRMCNCSLANVKSILEKSEAKLFEKAFRARRFDEFKSLAGFLFLASAYYTPAILRNFNNLEDAGKFLKGLLNKQFYLNSSIKDAERILSERSNLDFRLIRSEYPELAVDIDTPKDMKYIERAFGN